jgi:para-nitrobenzyl esterase
VAEILDIQNDVATILYPITGGTFLPNAFASVIAAGNVPSDVPVLIGSNKDEGDLFVFLEDNLSSPTYDTQTAYDAAVAILFSYSGLDAATIASDYIDFHGGYDDAAAPTDDRYRYALADLWTDRVFNYNNKVLWDQLSAVTDVYAYWFTDEQAPNSFQAQSTFNIGATHLLEIQYVFGTVANDGGTADQVALSNTMIDYWTNFARTGDPDPDGDMAVTWEPYTVGDEVVLQLDDPGPAITDVDDAGGFCDTHNCDYWESPPTL